MAAAEPAPVTENGHRRSFDAPLSANGTTVSSFTAPVDEPFVFEPAGATWAAEVPAVAVTDVANDVVDAAVAQPLPTPRDGADKLLAAPLESLGVVQLAERLALAIARRRNAVAPSAVMSPVPSFAVADAQPVEFSLPAPAPVVVAPVASVPTEPDQPAAVIPAQDFGTPPPMPAALRPINLHDGDDDVEPVASILPPRRFAMPTAVPDAAPSARATQLYSAPDTHASSAAPYNVAPGDPEAPAASESAENGYSSLLAVKPIVRQNPLTSADHDDEIATDALEHGFAGGAQEPDKTTSEQQTADVDVEPVVIFPGQAQFATPTPLPLVADIASAPVLAPSGLRRFDAPSSEPTQLRAPIAAAKVDPEETERALKAALATLQRMSGAA